MIKRIMLGASLVICAMFGFVAFASVPQSSNLTSLHASNDKLQLIVQGSGGLQKSKTDGADELGAGGAAKAFDVAQSTFPDAFGGFHGVTPVVVPALIQSEGLQSPSASNLLGQPVSLLANTECTRFGLASKKPLPLTKLVSLLRGGLDLQGQKQDSSTIRVRIQVYLNLSHDNPDLKAQAISRLQSDYAFNPAIRAALSEPFDLSDTGSAIVEGYDPCASPTAVGLGAFGEGPFADTFSTINPAPTTVLRTAAVTEGQSTF